MPALHAIIAHESIDFDSARVIVTQFADERMVRRWRLIWIFYQSGHRLSPIPVRLGRNRVRSHAVERHDGPGA